jgi:hypothetical protein
MSDSNKRIYAFDECSILHLCKIVIPATYTVYFSKEKLTFKNYFKLNALTDKLDHDEIPKYRFEPSNMDKNIIKVADELLAEEGNQVMILGRVLKAQIIDQLEEFAEDVMIGFKKILKKDNISVIRKLFMDNEKKLKKTTNVPSDDDLKIIAGYCDFDSAGDKHLITEDEHFWGYADLIFKNFNIKIIKEWECDKLCSL